jgi:hypothetical protein
MDGRTAAGAISPGTKKPPRAVLERGAPTRARGSLRHGRRYVFRPTAVGACGTDEGDRPVAQAASSVDSVALFSVESPGALSLPGERRERGARPRDWSGRGTPAARSSFSDHPVASASAHALVCRLCASVRAARAVSVSFAAVTIVRTAATLFSTLASSSRRAASAASSGFLVLSLMGSGYMPKWASGRRRSVAHPEAVPSRDGCPFVEPLCCTIATLGQSGLWSKLSVYRW